MGKFLQPPKRSEYDDWDLQSSINELKDEVNHLHYELNSMGAYFDREIDHLTLRFKFVQSHNDTMLFLMKRVYKERDLSVDTVLYDFAKHQREYDTQQRELYEKLVEKIIEKKIQDYKSGKKK